MAMTGHAHMDILKDYVKFALGDTARVHEVVIPGDH